jgi:hypothetical protein
MLQTILIGPARGNRKGGIAQFIRFALHYNSLAPRLFTAAAVWGVCKWLGWPVVANLGFLACEQTSILAGYRSGAKGRWIERSQARRHWVVSLVVGILIAVLIGVGAFLLLVSQQ